MEQIGTVEQIGQHNLLFHLRNKKYANHFWVWGNRRVSVNSWKMMDVISRVRHDYVFSVYIEDSSISVEMVDGDAIVVPQTPDSKFTRE